MEIVPAQGKLLHRGHFAEIRARECMLIGKEVRALLAAHLFLDLTTEIDDFTALLERSRDAHNKATTADGVHAITLSLINHFRDRTAPTIHPGKTLVKKPKSNTCTRCCCPTTNYQLPTLPGYRTTDENRS